MRKKLGQHFLTDRRVITRILETAQLTDQDRVVEIGPGNGILTTALAEQVAQLTAIEYDAALAAALQQTFADAPHVRVIHADARVVDYAALFSLAAGRLKVVANLPYYAAVPILFHLLTYPALFSDAFLMFQKEVAERLTAVPGTKAYGPLSVAAQYYSRPEWGFSIAPEAFRPSPRVDSAVVKLHFFDRPRVSVQDQDAFFHLVQCAFRSRRKTLKNSLAKNCAPRFPMPLLSRAFARLGLPEQVRGETLSLAQFAALSNVLVTLQSPQKTSDSCGEKSYGLS